MIFLSFRKLVFWSRLQALALAATFALTAGCSGGFFDLGLFKADGEKKTGEQEETGILDSGGGVTLPSSPEEVKRVINQAIRLASEPDHRRNIIARFFYENFAKFSDRIPVARQIYPRLPDLELNLNGTETQARIFENIKRMNTYKEQYVKNEASQFLISPVLTALSEAQQSNRIIFLDQGNCIAPNHKPADASVSELTTKATICFSIGNLKKLAGSDLLQQILSLVVHEAAHMGGANEEDAMYWQKRFEHYFTQRFSSIVYDHQALKLFTILDQASDELMAAKVLYEKHPGDPKGGVWVGQFIRSLSGLPNFPDPFVMELILQPKNPDRIPFFINAVIALIAETSRAFNISGIPIYPPLECDKNDPEQICPDLLQPSAKRTAREWADVFAKLEAMFKNVYSHALSLNSEIPDAWEPACVVPEESFNLDDIVKISMNSTGFAPVLPLRDCSGK